MKCAILATQPRAKGLSDHISTNGWVWWLMPVIPTIWVTKNQKIAVQDGRSIK
jgi:hypothetical protein